VLERKELSTGKKEEEAQKIVEGPQKSTFLVIDDSQVDTLTKALQREF